MGRLNRWGLLVAALGAAGCLEASFNQRTGVSEKSECRVDADCPSCGSCRNGQCTHFAPDLAPLSEAHRCRVNSDCTSGYCSAGFCRAVPIHTGGCQCEKNDQCVSNQCSDGICSADP